MSLSRDEWEGKISKKIMKVILFIKLESEMDVVIFFLLCGKAYYSKSERKVLSI